MAVETEERKNEIRKKRIATLWGSYAFMKERYREIRENTHLHKSLVAGTVEDYLRDREALVNRHNIKGRIQRHKVAGLMCAAIVKNRPIQLLEESSVSHQSMDNEVLAVLHGLAICADGLPEERIRAILSIPTFRGWYEDTVYHLHRQPSYTEGFIAIFHTFSTMHFPENLLHDEKSECIVKPTMDTSEKLEGVISATVPTSH